MAHTIYTASLLKEGLVAYLCIGDDGSFWSTDIHKATTDEKVGLDTLKAEAERAEQQNIIIAPYEVAVEETELGIVPVDNRERIRASGPTILLPGVTAEKIETGALVAA